MPEFKVTLPTFHPGQLAAWELSVNNRYTALCCGRRFGKTDLLKIIAADAVIKGQNVGIFTPNYKIQAEIYTELLDLISPIHKSASRMEGVIRTITDGRIDFWSLENERAGRSRKYHVALIDEAAFTKPNMLHVWETAIKPALFDYGGKCFAASTPNGNKKTNFFYAICNDPKYEFVKYHAPTHQNPLIPARNPDESDADYLARRQDEFDNLKATNEARVYRQEFLAEFVDWSGDAFFDEQNFLYLGQPVNLPTQCDSVFAVIDTAVKTGKEHDGTAVTYFAIDKIGQFKLIVADWEILQIQGSMLEVWVPSVFRRCEELAAQCKARFGSLGVFIEDKYSGSVLIQQIKKRIDKVHAIDSKLTALGKDERAINISTYIHRQMVKISREAYEKQAVFKGINSNHWLDQVCGFHLDEPDQADDLLDTLCYGATIALGGRNGF